VFWRAQREGEERPEGSVEGGGFIVVPDMMSLVGCSGDEFSSILKSLGFSAQRRKVEAVEPVAGATEDSHPEPAAETVEAEAAASEAPTAEAEAAEPAEEPALASEPEQVQEAEPQFIEVWWPKDTGPFRHQKQAHRQFRHQKQAHRQARGGKPGGKGKPRDANAANKPRRSNGSRPAKPHKEREADPNSPFAVLGQLKQDLGRK
jgi:ATP-dependent RNA helicase SUPV3L1/SUV3